MRTVFSHPKLAFLINEVLSAILGFQQSRRCLPLSVIY